MTSKVRLWAAGATIAAVVGLVYLSGPSLANEGDKDLPETVKKIATEIKKGNAAGAKTMSEAAAKKIEDTAELMHLFRPHSKGGLGWGGKRGTNPASDGLEKKIQEFSKTVPANIAAQVDNNVEAAGWLQAMADLTLAKVPAKDAAGGKTKKAWIGWSEDMRKASAAFNKAAAAKDAAGMQKAASQINNACVSCHSKFKE
jgi:hypothetical protein